MLRTSADQWSEALQRPLPVSRRSEQSKPKELAWIREHDRSQSPPGASPENWADAWSREALDNRAHC